MIHTNPYDDSFVFQLSFSLRGEAIKLTVIGNKTKKALLNTYSDLI